MRDFDQDAAQQPVLTPEQRAFKLGGQVLHFRDRIPGQVMTMFGEIDADTPVMQDMQKLGGMIFQLVDEPDHDNLRTALASTDPLVDMGQLAEVIGWILGESSNRPLSQSSGSGDSADPGTSTPGLTAASHLQAAGG